MPDGPVVALVILVAGLAVLGVVIYMVERRHAGRRKQTPARLPLFGTDQLSIRGLQGEADADAFSGLPPVSRPVPTRPRPQPPARPEPPRLDARPVENQYADSLRRDSPRAERARTETADARPTPAERMYTEPVRTEPTRRETRPQPAGVEPAHAAWQEATRSSDAAERTPSAQAVPSAAPPAAAPRPGDFAPRAPSVRPAPPQVTASTTEEYPVGSPNVAPTARGPHDASAAIGSDVGFDAALIEGETLRFTVPTDGTVEFLPGHLEVVAGPDAGKEIRFVRAFENADVEVTFGRSEGPPHRHIQILARTVSRRHAVMSLIDEHWQLTNLSSTNPVVLNGRLLAGNEVAPLLVEGDRIEMGEVVFLYHDA